MTEEIVRFQLSEDVAHITMDDGKANALSHAMIDALNAAFERARDDASAVLLSGREGKFCAGFDLGTLLSGPEAARELLTTPGPREKRVMDCVCDEPAAPGPRRFRG